MNAKYLHVQGQSPCSGLIQQPGLSASLGASDADKAEVTFKCQVGKGFKNTRVPRLGDKHSCYRNMCAVNVQITSGEGFDTIKVTYEGFLNSGVKVPTGGVGQQTSEGSIELHPNYESNKYSWGTIIGEGNASPNEYGRYVDDDGRFKYFGPLPDGKDGRPEPAEKNTDCIKVVTDLCRLEGVENFLEAGQVTYTYEIVTKTNWAEKHTDKICKIVAPKSRLIPVPDLPARSADEHRDWLLKDIQIEATKLNRSLSVHKTTLEFLSSGSGGWNALIYQDGGSIDLDGDSGAKGAFSGIR